ncbi:hypothetical protein FC789_13050 [Clostridium botulinum]|nr:hypothetical protein [Clostridium botulinum]
MKSIYMIYQCKRCRKTSILLTDEVEETLKNNNYLSCAHCGCKNLKREKETDNAKDCMDSAHYKRVKRALRQVN